MCHELCCHKLKAKENQEENNGSKNQNKATRFSESPVWSKSAEDDFHSMLNECKPIILNALKNWSKVM